MHEEGEGAHTVLQVFQAGYTLHERVLRPALVKVGPPPQEQEQPAADKTPPPPRPATRQPTPPGTPVRRLPQRLSGYASDHRY